MVKMDSFCTITPTRGDRPELLEFCKHQLQRMTIRPAQSYFINYPPKSKHFDLTERVIEGVRRAALDGFDKVFIVEEDDFYNARYFEHFTFHGNDKIDFIGSRHTVYYSVRHQRYTEINHPGRSSLFTTGFKISSLNGFKWPDPTEVFLDLKLWEFAAKRKYTKFIDQDIAPFAIGIKHGLGLCGGKGHTMTHKQWDDRLDYLCRHTDSEAFQFYVGLMQKNGWL